MEIESLVEELGGQDASRAAEAGALLAEEAARPDRTDAVVTALLTAAAGIKGSRELQPLTEVARRIGPPAFDAVVAAWRREELGDFQTGRFLAVFDERCADRYAALAADTDRRRSGHGFSGLVRLRVDSEAGLRVLVDACSRGRRVPDRAAEYARRLIGSFGPRLRLLRRDPAASPRTRRGALAALVAGGGVDALDPRDLALVERLIRVKIPHEVTRLPAPVLSGWWLAVPGARYEGLFEALGLHDRRPVTVSAGIYAAEGGRDTVRLPGPDGTGRTGRTVGRAFITPELDGWRLLYGSLHLLLGEPWHDMMDTVERISAHCGQAQFFFLDDHGGTDIWVVAEEGRTIRRYAAESDPEWEGDPLPWETLAVDDEDYDPEYDDQPSNAGTTGARSACGYLSVDPGEVGPDTRVAGHGWLVLTDPDAGHGVFPGTLPI